MMDDLISRQAAIDALGKKPLAWVEGEYELGQQNQWENDVDAIKSLPSARPERKKGKWIYSDDDDRLYDSYFCYCCHRYITVDAERKCDIGFIIDDFDYCPFCGADMRGEQDELRS